MGKVVAKYPIAEEPKIPQIEVAVTDCGMDETCFMITKSDLLKVNEYINSLLLSLRQNTNSLRICSGGE